MSDVYANEDGYLADERGFIDLSSGWVFALGTDEDGGSVLWAFNPDFDGISYYDYPVHEGTTERANASARRLVETVERRCHGIRADGRKCHGLSRDGSGYCHHHIGQVTPR